MRKKKCGNDCDVMWCEYNIYAVANEKHETSTPKKWSVENNRKISEWMRKPNETECIPEVKKKTKRRQKLR